MNDDVKIIEAITEEVRRRAADEGTVVKVYANHINDEYYVVMDKTPFVVKSIFNHTLMNTMKDSEPAYFKYMGGVVYDQLKDALTVKILKTPLK